MIYAMGVPIMASVGEIVRDMRRELGGEVFNDIEDIGSDLMVTCPFHKGGRERKPSLGIRKAEYRRGKDVIEAGVCHCFTCGYSGDLMKLVSDVLELGGKIEGFNWLVNRYLYGAGDSRGEIILDLDREENGEDGVEVDLVLITHYQNEFRNSERAKNYIRGRKIGDRVCEIFGLGYDAENDSVIFPILDRVGQVRMMKGRSIEGKRFNNTKGAFKTDVVFGLYQVLEYGDKDKPVWICESEIDALTVWEYGGQAVAIMGADIGEGQIKELCKTWVRKLIDGLDRDDAGRKGWKKIKKSMIPIGFRLWNTKDFSSKKDINELTKEEFENINIY